MSAKLVLLLLLGIVYGAKYDGSIYGVDNQLTLERIGDALVGRLKTIKW